MINPALTSAADRAADEPDPDRRPGGSASRSGARRRRRGRGDGRTTRAAIERAALALFAARGIEAATTRAIAAAAGISEGALYRHFPSKEAIAERLFIMIHERLARLVRESSATGLAIEERARAIVAAYCATADEDWTLFAYHLLSTAHFLPTPPGDDNPAAAAEDIVAAAMARGEIPKGDPVIVAAMALGVVLQTALHKAHGRIEGPLSAHAETLAAGVMAVLKSGASS